MKDKHLATSSITLRVTVPERELKISVLPDRQKYGPGERITYQVQVTDSKGQPAAAEFSFGVVDESIYALREDDPTELRYAFYPRRYNQVQTRSSFEAYYLGDADKS